MIQIVAFPLSCSFLCDIPDRPHENQIRTKGHPLIETVIELPKDSSHNLFLKAVLVKFWSLKPRQISVVVSNVFKYFILKKLALILGSIFFAPLLMRKRKFFVALFSKNYRNPTRPCSRINPA